MTKVKILVVEDERIVARDIQNTLKLLGYDVPAIASNGEEAIKKAREIRPDIILMDIVLKGDIDGIETVRRIRTEQRIPVIYLTAYEDDDTIERAKITEPLGYILKPFEERDLHTTIEMAIYKHRMEAKLLDSEERYRRLVEYSPDGIAVEHNGKLVFVNPAAVKLIGENTETYLLGKNIMELIPVERHEVTKQKFRFIYENNLPLPFIDGQFIKTDGNKIDVEVAMVPFPFEGKTAAQIIFRDVTARKHSEEELKNAYSELKKTQQALIQNEKLAALGRFSAGIAHEIRNPLANISASAQFCMTKFNFDEHMKKHFDVILRNADTANRIIKELLDFASPREILLNEGRIENVIDRICELVKPRCMKHNINLHKEISEDIPAIRINEKKLEEAFMNFVSNAIEAMTEGGTLTIKTSRQDKNVLIDFIDTGYGIKQEDQDKIFEPFFTTKDEGTGLGLSLAYHIISAHSGEVSIDSKLQKGTKISVKLPIKNNIRLN
ncbi:MAG: hybrid sensor histidine kinase/response regulator [Ignavibacteriae bacterium]|nr:MAG: hybrid sensor histidine kinase/response regulator [Ignavibacteriota bacterium]